MQDSKSLINRMFSNQRKNSVLVIVFVWLLMWVTPWSIWLESFPWVALGISLLIFVLPGTLISILLINTRYTLLTHIISGFAISIFIVSILGVFGRIVQLPFSYIKTIFSILGFIVLIIFFRRFESLNELYRSKKYSYTTLLSLLFLIVMSIIANFQSSFRGDDFNYLAYLTNWQHAQPLNFAEIFFGVGTIDKVRFWLAMVPMNWALLAEISNLHGILLLGYYLEPFLVIFAILAIFSLYDEFLQTDHQRITAVLLHMTIFFLLRDTRQPGRVFFERLSEDKVLAAFILAPMFFLALRNFLERATFNKGILLLVIGLSVGFTHPIILTYSIFIGGIFTLIVTYILRDSKKFVLILGFLIIIMMPFAFLRFISVPWVSQNIFGLQSSITQPGQFDLDSALERGGIESRIAYIEGTPFYGFGLDRIKIQDINQENHFFVMLFAYVYLWLLVLGFLWSVFNLRKETSAPFIFAASLLVLLCAIPYTGWLMGYFVSARMLWRSPWMLPVGLIGVVLVGALESKVKNKLITDSRFHILHKINLINLLFIICFFLIIYFSLVVNKTEWTQLTVLHQRRNNLMQLAALGNYLEKTIDPPSVFVANKKLLNLFSGLSSKSKPVIYRGMGPTPLLIDSESLALILSTDLNIPISKRIGILNKYHIKYIITQDLALKDLYSNIPQSFSLQKTGDYWIIELYNRYP